jgi:hypothetical protein
MLITNLSFVSSRALSEYKQLTAKLKLDDSETNSKTSSLFLYPYV